ncbi:MAG: hypothetical protein K8S99_13740 [Planctomycetes bacterium]|nr:hypothetical protein [Planctomycetota bacterium]
MSDLVGFSIPCTKCGYDLRGTASGGACPECGSRTPLDQSMLRVHGKFLIVRGDAVLPHRCVKTNEPVENGVLRQELKRVHPVCYWMPVPPILLFWLGFIDGAWPVVLCGLYEIIWAIACYVSCKRCWIMYFVSPREEKRRLRNIRIVASVALVGVTLFLVHLDIEGFLLPYLLGFGAAAGTMIWLWPTRDSFCLSLAKTKHGENWIKGCGPAFLASIEEARPW